MVDEPFPELTKMLYLEMAQRAQADPVFKAALFKDTESALTAYFGRPISLSRLSVEQQAEWQRAVQQARLRLSQK